MRRVFNLCGLFGPAKPTTITLSHELDERLRRIEAAQAGAEKMARDIVTGRHAIITNGLCLRLDAAAAVQIRRLMKQGRTTLVIPPGQTVDRVLLGAQAGGFGVYARNLESDLRLAMG